NVQPRLHRTARYALIRAATNASMQEMSFFMLTSDILQGIPVVYNTFFGYDEVAHHSGPRSPDAFKTLTQLDTGFRELRKATADAPRPYHLVVLSDHGQSAGATFKQRFGHSLEDVVRQSVSSQHAVESFEGQSESMGNASAAVSATLRNTGWVGDQVARRTPAGNPELRGSTRPRETAGTMRDTDGHDIMVMASGNLGVIYFTSIPQRVMLEDLEVELPDLIPTLVAHPGVSFVMVHARTDDEAVVIGPHGRRYLRSDRIDGMDPLANFLPTSRQHLLRSDTFTNVPDIMVMSMFDPETGETAAFEELIGNHGGLGGPQQEPFVFHPPALQFPTTPVIGAAAVHLILKSWVPEDTTQNAVPSQSLKTVRHSV
ncbi:MAG TPA: alkaline phosphatase family protein, partial [Thermomicrobiales bacterium]|nr:alkaline phosphatase family protein [Thermomicrobiales bacterium]